MKIPIDKVKLVRKASRETFGSQGMLRARVFLDRKKTNSKNMCRKPKHKNKLED